MKIVGQLEGFEAAGGGVGGGNPPGAARRLRARLARRPLSCRASRLGAAAAAQRTGERRRRPPRPGADDTDHAARAAPCGAMGLLVGKRGGDRTELRGAAPLLGTIRDNGASFFEESSTGPACCAPRSRKRSPNSLRSGSSFQIVSRACARCWCLRPSANRSSAGRASPAHRAVRHRGRRPLGARRRARGRARPRAAGAAADAVEHVARILLRRYGVVFWRLLEREADWLPPWRDLLRVYRRLEARGEIRGGRFVAGFSGEQFALPEAIGSCARCGACRLQAMALGVRRRSAQPCRRGYAGAEASALTGNRVLYRDGIPIALFAAR